MSSARDQKSMLEESSLFAVEEVEQKLKIIQEQEDVRTTSASSFALPCAAHCNHNYSLTLLQVIAQMKNNVTSLEEQVLALKRVTGKTKQSPRKAEQNRLAKHLLLRSCDVKKLILFVKEILGICSVNFRNAATPQLKAVTRSTSSQSDDVMTSCERCTTQQTSVMSSARNVNNLCVHLIFATSFPLSTPPSPVFLVRRRPM